MLGGGQGKVRIVLRIYRESLYIEACVGVCNFALRHATRVKFPDLGERRTGYRLAFEVKAYDLSGGDTSNFSS